MSQHDMDLADAAGASFRADANLALVALVSNNSGAAEPATKFAYMTWADTANDLMKQRNAANSAWIAKGTISAANGGLAALSGASFTGGINDARGTIAMHATTMDLWSHPNVIDGTGSSVTITAIANAPQAGARRILYPITGTNITNGATFAVDGGVDYTSAAGDCLIFEAITTSTYTVHITRANGLSLKQAVQVVSASLASVATGTTVIPIDDTVPQKTEGDQYLTCTITPKNASSQLFIECYLLAGSSIAQWIGAALFQDSTENAFSALANYLATAGAATPFAFKAVITAGTTSPTTIKLRVGGGGAATTTVNGAGGSRYYGGAMGAYIIITEYLP